MDIREREGERGARREGEQEGEDMRLKLLHKKQSLQFKYSRENYWYNKGKILEK